MLVLAGLLAAADSAEPRMEICAGWRGLARPAYLIIVAAHDPASTELRATATHLPFLHEIARLGGGRVLKGPEELQGSRRALSAGLAVWRPVTALALLVFLAHVARGNGFGSRS